MKSTQNKEVFYSKIVFVIIFCFSIIRGIIAFSMELGTDEAYYWLYSQDIKWNYFDHPPMVAVWIRLFTANLSLQDTEGFIRLGSVIGCGISSWAMYKTISTIHTEKAGLYGVLLYNASFYATVTTGIFIMPDTPQMVFYTLALWMITRITKNEKDIIAWILFGIAAGLCIMSKVYGAFLWTGVGIYAILKKKAWFSQPHLYVSFLLTAIIVSPILIWNFQNVFLTYKFHSSRADVTSGGFDLLTFGREVMNQLLFNNPINVVVITIAFIAIWKQAKAKETSTETISIFNFIGLPLIILLLLISFFRDTTLPHWSGPGYVALIPMAAIFLSNQTIRNAKKILLASIGSLFLFLVVWQYLIHYAPERIGARDEEKNKFSKGRYLAKRLFSGFENFQLIAETRNSWEPARKDFLTLYEQETTNGKMEKNTPVICYKWWGAHIEYYFCYPSKIPMIGLGEPDELHEYLFINGKRKDSINMNTAYCIVPADDFYNVQSKYAQYYQKIENPSILAVKRAGKPDVKFFVYRLSGWKHRMPVVETKIGQADLFTLIKRN